MILDDFGKDVVFGLGWGSEGLGKGFFMGVGGKVGYLEWVGSGLGGVFTYWFSLLLSFVRKDIIFCM